MLDRENIEGLAFQGKVLGIEITLLMLLQRVEEGRHALAAALISIDDIHAGMLGAVAEGRSTYTVEQVDELMAAAGRTVEKMAEEAQAFWRGDGVELRG